MKQPGTSLIARSRSLIALVLLIAFFAWRSANFATLANLENVLEQTARNAIIAAGMTFVILTGGIDLSVGSVLAFAGIAGGILMERGWWAPLGIWVAVLAGCACGLVNGALVAVGRLPAFIATLGMMSAARGLALLASSGQPISGFSPTFVQLWHGRFLGVPVPLVVMFVVYVVSWWILERTAFGLHVYALGGNEKAAWLAGVNTRRTTLAVYGISGALAGLAAVLVTARLNTAQPTAGATAELEAIAACVIGGLSLTGGEGKIGGTLIGALIMSVLMNGLNLLDVSTYTQKVIIGLVIVLAVFVDRLVHGKAR